MFVQLLVLLKRDKWKLLVFLGSVLFVQSLGGGLLPPLPRMIVLNIVAVSIGILAYWAKNLPVQRIAPWAFWGSLFVIIRLLQFAINSWVLPSMLQDGTLSMSEMMRTATIFSGIFGVLFGLVYFFLFPFMMSVWNNVGIIEGYKQAVNQWGKWLVFGGLIFLKGLIPAWKILTLHLLVLELFNWLANWVLWIIIFYVFSIWVRPSGFSTQHVISGPYEPKVAQQAASTQQKIVTSNSIHPLDVKDFFNILLAQDIPAIQAKLTQQPSLARSVWPSNGNTPLHVAAWNGWTDIVKLLLQTDNETRQILNQAGKYPYDLALEKGHTDIADLLK